MWLFSSWGAHADFGYDIGEHVTSFHAKSMWTLFKAKKKGTGESLSIFRIDIKGPNDPLLEKARASLKRLKTLRHPSFLKYVDSSETEKFICIVTEAITPLEVYLDEISDNYSQQQREFTISYGILNVAKGLNFLINDCSLNHNNINIHSIFVNSSGVWKIGGLDYVCPQEELPPSKTENLSSKYNPPERLDPSKKILAPKHAVDSWGLGCLIWESFNGALTPTSSVKTVGKMPRQLSGYYNKLVQSNPKHRISPSDFIKECRTAKVFFSNPLLETILFLEEIQIKESTEKTKFFNKLEGELESFPADICKNKILPELMNAFEFGDAGSAILNPIFRIGKMLDKDEYQKKLVPCIIKLFACKDRATRSKLLQQIETFIDYMQPNIINEQIFQQVAQGFLDSNFRIREQTVKSMLHLAPKLNYANLNEELLKHFARLQFRDEEGGIRANTTICLGKIAKFLHTQTQQTVLIPAFLRSMKDPFPPARCAAIMAITANETLFSPKDCATKIMPALSHMCVDTEANVRGSAIKSMNLFLQKVEAYSESQEATNNSSAAPASVPQASEKSLNQSAASNLSGGDK